MTNQVDLKKLAEYTEEKIRDLTGYDLVELLKDMNQQIDCRKLCEQHWELTGYSKDREPGIKVCREEAAACEKVLGLILCRLREELKPFGENLAAEADDLDATGWDREVNCRSIQELLTRCYWFAIYPLPALSKRHRDYRWLHARLSESADATVPVKLAQLMARADFVFAANGDCPESGEFIFAFEKSRTRPPRRIFSGSLKDDGDVKEAQKLLKRWKHKFVQLQEVER